MWHDFSTQLQQMIFGAEAFPFFLSQTSKEPLSRNWWVLATCCSKIHTTWRTRMRSATPPSVAKVDLQATYPHFVTLLWQMTRTRSATPTDGAKVEQQPLDPPFKLGYHLELLWILSSGCYRIHHGDTCGKNLHFQYMTIMIFHLFVS